MALSLKKQCERAAARVSKLMDEIYAVTPRTDIPFDQCCAMAPAELLERYESAVSDKVCLEFDAVCQGKAWRGQSNMLHWYR